MPDEGSKFSDDEKDATSNHKLKFPWGLGGGGRMERSYVFLISIHPSVFFQKKALMVFKNITKTKKTVLFF
jgi:hypothetical protein